MKKLAVFAIATVLGLAFSSPAIAQFGEVVYEIDGMDNVIVQNFVYRTVDGTALTMDVYYPPDMDSSLQLPAVILVNGFRDRFTQSAFGFSVRNTDINMSWGRLIAASGLIAVLYDSDQPDDLIELVSYIQQNAETLHIDGERIGTIAFSSSGTAALSYTMQPQRRYVKVAVFYYCDMITTDGKFDDLINGFNENFPNPGDRGIYLTSELERIRSLRSDLPVLIVRTGADHGENVTIDHFVGQALTRRVPLTLINYQEAMHGFDYRLDTERTYEIIEFTLQFLKSNLEVE